MIFFQEISSTKNVNIERIPYNNLYIARCLVDKIGDYINVKKGRIINVVPRKILLTDIVLNKKRKICYLYLFTNVPWNYTQEKKVKNSYIRIDHSRRFMKIFRIAILCI